MGRSKVDNVYERIADKLNAVCMWKNFPVAHKLRLSGEMGISLEPTLCPDIEYQRVPEIMEITFGCRASISGEAIHASQGEVILYTLEKLERDIRIHVANIVDDVRQELKK